MDDQRTDREGSSIIRRLRISLRLMLLAVTLLCVLCAYYRVHCDNVLRAELAESNVQVDDLKNEIELQRWGPRDPELDLFLRDATDRVAEINEQLRGKRATKTKVTWTPNLATQIARRLAQDRG